MRQVIEYMLLAVVLVLVLGSLLGVIMNRPVFVSYAYSESMKPTINKGDVFFINPFERNPEVGDIVVFKTGNIWTVHRVFAITEEGYITKGDNNIATDQQSHNIPPISKESVAGTVITVGNTPIKIPKLGDYIGNSISDRGKILLAGFLIILGVVAFTSGEATNSRKKKRTITVRFKTLYLLASAFLLIMIAIATFVSWEVVPIQFSVTSAGGVREGWYLPGEEFQQEITIRNNNFYPMLYYISAEYPATGVSLEEFKLQGRGEKKLVVTIQAPMETSLYMANVRVNAYIPLLPSSVIERLYRINPMVPLMVILMEVAAFLGLVYLVSGIGDEEVIKIRRRRRPTIRGISEVFRV